MDYEPYDDYSPDYEDDEEDIENCPFGSPLYPQLGTEDCDWLCSFREDCKAAYNKQPDCVNPKRLDEKGIESIFIECVYFHFGKCYINLSNYKPKSRLKMILIRLKCGRGKHPKKIKEEIDRHYD